MPTQRERISHGLREAIRGLDLAAEEASPGWMRDELVISRRALAEGNRLCLDDRIQLEGGSAAGMITFPRSKENPIPFKVVEGERKPMSEANQLRSQFSDAMTSLASLHDGVEALATPGLAPALHKAVNLSILGLGDAARRIAVSEAEVEKGRELRDHMEDATDDALRRMADASAVRRATR